MLNQKTIAGEARFAGIGLHSGKPVGMTVSPARAGEGITFDLGGQRIAARHDRVEHRPLCTLLCGDGGVSISTVEHFMAAVWALGLTNLWVSLDSDELPIMDGSALPFVRGLVAAGVVDQKTPARYIRVVKPVAVAEGESSALLLPAVGFSAAVSIDFDCSAIGRQAFEFDGSFESFMGEVAMARTFCMSRDIEEMHEAGRALGGSLENALVFDGDRVLNPLGLRVESEPVRHKVLDALGDLYLAGGFLQGHFEAHRPGHRLTNLLLRKAFEEGAILEVANAVQPAERAEIVAA